MKPRLLVVTSVHPADDPRIREKLIRPLVAEFDVLYATQAPAPSDLSGLDWIELTGSRHARRSQGASLLKDGAYDVAVAHDPELLPATISAAKRGYTVVFDVHENIPDQIRTKASIPGPARWPLAWVARRLLDRAESRGVHITLAEDGYLSLFATPHPVFPNYPNMDQLPDPVRSPDGPIVYVGDVTEIRGALTLVEAVGMSEHRRSIVYVGRCSDALASRIAGLAKTLGVDVDIVGWLPYAEAMKFASRAAVGTAPLHDIPNYRNSLPTKTLEYLAVGTPTVASDLPGTRSVIGELQGVVLTAPGDVAALAGALDSVLGSPAVADAAFGAANQVRGEYQWPAEEVRSFYQSLLLDG